MAAYKCINCGYTASSRGMLSNHGCLPPSYDTGFYPRPTGGTTDLLREDKTGKTDYTYLTELKPIIDRICQRFTEGEIKYSRLNWRNAKDNLTYKQSAMRHMMQYMNGETDEDHGIATIINLLILLDLEERA